MTCLDCPTTVARGPRCRACAQRRKWSEGRVHRTAKRPLKAQLCRCDVSLTDGDDECVLCGHLVCEPDPDKRELKGLPSSMGRLYVLPGVITRVGRIAA